MLLYLYFLLSNFMGQSVEDAITPEKDVEHTIDSNKVKLSCRYNSSQVNSLLWYRQYPGSAPQFLILDYSGYLNNPIPGLSIRHVKEQSRVDLEISSAAVTDSALYYCAVKLNAGVKLVFSSGTSLLVQTRDRNFPSYYKLRSNDSAGNISACLASDFSNFNDTKDPANKMLFNRTEATRMTGDRFYSEVALYPAGETDRCREESKPKCSEDFFEPDEKVNFLALTILGLRLLFLKTVVFNILMTLRLWVS